MKRKNKIRIIASLIMLGLATLSCSIDEAFNWVPVTLCEITGGTWTTTDKNGNPLKKEVCSRPGAVVDVDGKEPVPDPVPAPVDEHHEDDAGDDEKGERPDACVAYPDDYSWEFFDTTIETGSSGTLCQSNFRLQNTSGTTLIVYPFLETSAGSTGNQYAGYGPGGKILKPGESFEDRVNHTSYDNDEITFRRYTMVLVLYNDPACLWMNPDMAEQEQIADSFVELLNPCD